MKFALVLATLFASATAFQVVSPFQHVRMQMGVRFC